MSNIRRIQTCHARVAIFFAMVALAPSVARAGAPPMVGDEAGDFELPSLGGEAVKLSILTDKGTVVLIVLRGYPGYQCPICSRQVGEFLAKADEFKQAGAQVVFIYPGPADELKQRAGEFIKGATFPENFLFLLDPDYTFTNAYGLRWNAPKETAYPSTFVIDGKRIITFAKISKTHGGRSNAAEVLEAAGAK